MNRTRRMGVRGRRVLAVQDQKATFLLTGTLVYVCAAAPCTTTDATRRN